MRKQVEKYGFTLIELLAVIVILGVLSLIVTPFILGVIESARKGAAVNSAYGYVDAIEKSSLQDMIDKSDYQNKKNGTYNAETIKPVKYKGADPLDVCVTIENGEVTAGSFQFGKYVVDYNGGKASINEEKENAGCGGNSETPEEEPKTPDDLKDDTKIKNGENYYIGANPNNWVLFGRADESDNKSLLMWRIVKIDKVGIKMVYEGIQNGEKVPLEDGRALLNGTMGVAWNRDSSNFWNTSDLKEKLSTWLSRISVLDLEKYVSNTTWKVGGIPDLNPTPLRSFLESGGIDSIVDSRSYQGVTNYQSPIGMISPWDYMYTSSNEECSKSYVSAGTSNECSIGSDGALNNFLYKNKYSYWTMNAVSSASNQAWNITNSGIIASRQTNYSIYSVRPVLNLKLDTKFLTGDGTIENPYILEDYLANLFVKPELKLNGDKVVVLHQGEEYIDAGATATDAQDGDITSKITVVSNLDNQKLGSYTITYNVQDSDGNKAIPITRTVKVVDKDTPVITLNGENPTEVIIGSTYAEPGYIAMDPNYGDISSSITIEGTVDTSTLGIYYRTYHVKNQDGLEAVPVERRVIVKASVPVITLNGSSLTLVDVGTSYTEEGATATDSYYGDLTNSITQKYTNYNETSKSWESVSNIDSNVAGSYKVRYTVTNQFGANAYVDRVVQVVKAAGPTITYTPSSDTTSKNGHSTRINVAKKTYDVVPSSQKYFTVNTLTGFTSPGTIAGFESLFKISYQNGAILNISKGTGKYYFYAIAKDIYQDTTYQKSGLFQMDHSAPLITLNGGTMKVLLGNTYTDPGANAFDQWFDGDLTSKITTQNNVDTSKEGTYQVIYKVSDSAGNETTKVRNVIVYHSVPTIGLLGGSKVRVRYGSTYTEPGYTAKDEADGDITSQVTVTGTVDTSKEGSYTLTYNVKNSSGKETTKERTVEVYIPSPVITLKGENPVKIKVESTYTDLGATATDEIDGNITSKITTTSTIDTSVEGTYEIIYQVTNNLGKTSTAKRIVIVYSEVPTITLKGDSPTILYKGEAYQEAGYTATDEVDGDITDKVKVSGSVDTSTSGTYILLYEVTNRYGKKTTVKRSVIVRAPAIKLILNGESTVTLLRGTNYVEAGYSANDEFEGDITSSITMDLGGLDINKAGTYTITYTAQNSGGDTASIKRTVIIRNPNVVITLKGDSTIQVPIGYPYSDPGATASDELLGDISSNITLTHNINTNVLGTYQVTYQVVSSGVTATKVRSVRVIPLAGPIVKFESNGMSTYQKVGSTMVTILKNNYEVEATSLKYQWTKELSKPDETSFETSFTSGDTISTPTGKTGNYYLWILAKDTYGNTTIVPSNTFKLDNTAPILLLKGKTLLEIPADSVYQDPGVTVVEPESGLNEDGVVVTSNVVSGVIGTYQVIYTATDKVGNVSIPVKRTVSVVEASLKDAPGEGYVKKYDTSYFVGENPNNYVLFGNAADNNYDYIPIYWRIVKADDSGIKIVYEGVKEGTSIKQNGTIGTYSYDSTNNNYNRPADIESVLNNFYTNLKDEDKETLTKAINWCVNATPSPYNMDAFRAEECKTLSTNKSVIGLLSGLDYFFTTEAACDAYNQASCGSQNFLKKSYNYYTMSSDSISSVSEFIVNSNGALTRAEVTTKQNIRPVINLRPDVLIKGGEGTIEKPYQLNSRVPVQDTKAPTVSFSPNTATGNIDGVEVLVSDDISGVDNGSLKYLWNTSTTSPAVDKFGTSFSNGDKIKVPSTASGVYYLWILAKDKKGNQSISKSGSYRLDTVPPVITLKGDNPYVQLPGIAYTDPGATATDGLDGTIAVQITSTVNPNVEGTYQVIYTATDKSGNQATATRTVVIGYVEIRTPEDFYNIRNNTKAGYKLMNDIDFTTSQWSTNFPTIPTFSGTLDGNNNKIIGLKLKGYGLFNTLGSGSVIRNIQFEKAQNYYAEKMGLIAGTVNASNIEISNILIDNLSIISTTTNYGYNTKVGGLIGVIGGGSVQINKVGSSGTISGASYVGGLIGSVEGAAELTIENSWNVGGTIKNIGYSGGFIGNFQSTGKLKIQNSYNATSISSTSSYIGGLVGSISTSSSAPALITNCFNIGRITGYQYVGGITGNFGYGNSKTSYSTDTVYQSAGSTDIGKLYIGGIAGLLSGDLNNNYLLGNVNGTSGVVQRLYGNTSWQAHIYNSSWISYQNSLKKSSFVGFDFDNVWEMQEGSTLPYLKDLPIPPAVIKNS